MNDDWDLIVSSFQTQYGIRLSKDLKGMSWREFSYLVSGLSHDTPLGTIVSIRSEKDPEVLKDFTVDQKRIRNEYLRKAAKNKSEKEVASAIENFKNMFIGLAGGINEET